MKLLVIDTSTTACVLGIQVGDELFANEAIVDRSHSTVILERIDELVARAGVSGTALNAIVYGQGPGSFTGLRIGVGVTQGLAFGWQIPTVGVSSLAALAQQAFRKTGATNILVALHAREQEVYFGAFVVDEGTAQPVCEEGVFDAAQLPLMSTDKHWVLVGDSFHLQSIIESRLGFSVTTVADVAAPAAEDLVRLGGVQFTQGNVVAAELAQPQYLTETVATKRRA